MKSIQTKFIILILGCVLLSSCVIGGTGIYRAKTVVDEDSTEMMNLLCNNNAQNLNAQLTRIEQSVHTLAVYALGQLESVERLKTDPEYLSAYTKRLTDVAVNAADNTEGAMAVYVRFNPDFAAPTSGLFWSKTLLNGSFQELTPTDFSAFSPQDTEHVGWYYTPVKNGKATWMPPYLNRNINVRMISYVIPLYAGNETIGVVGMDIDFDIIQSAVESVRVYDSGYAFLVDENANVVLHHELENGLALGKADAGLLGMATVLRESGDTGTFLYSYSWRGQEKRMAADPLRNGMRLALVAPISEIDRVKNTLTWQIVVSTGMIALISVLLTVLVTRKMIKPLRDLNTAAQKIAAGDLSITISHQAKDEVGTLADSFQQTVAHLQKYIDYINSLAYRDSLTGIKNKTAYLEAASRLEEQMRLGRPAFAVVALDINNLKAVNDTCGHDFGDMLIVDACKLICKAFPHSPAYRIGGDEFVVLLENGDYEHYAVLLAQFHRDIEQFNAASVTGGKVSIALGIALYNYETDLVFANVFKRADESMYRNKAAMKQAQAASETNVQQTDAQAGLPG